MSLEEPLSTEDVHTLAGVPDGFNRFQTPYQMAYTHGEGKPSDSSDVECPLYAAPARSDEKGLIVCWGQSYFIIMNLFPYNSGHLLVCPYHRVSYYTDLNKEERIEFGELTVQVILVEKEATRPQGFNIDINQGKVAGAGTAAHLHQCIVPRWLGDTNSLPITARTRAVPELLKDVRSYLAAVWPKKK